MKYVYLLGAIFLFFNSTASLAIPPAIPGNSASEEERIRAGQQNVENLYSPEAQKLVNSFFEKLEEDEPFDLKLIFDKDAYYTDSSDSGFRIQDELYDDGSPMIPQWNSVSIFMLSNCWAAAVSLRLDPLGVKEAVLKFYFSQNESGALRISRVEEVKL